MKKVNVLVGVLIIALIIESATIALLSTQSRSSIKNGPNYRYVHQGTMMIPYEMFNQPISNDTEYSLNQELVGSWSITIQSDVVASADNKMSSEAQIAIAPQYPTENLSIPTIIVQERGDGLLRVEYYAQNWNNTYGLILYNATSPSWLDGNVTLKFMNYGPPSKVNPQIAPYPNGNLTIIVGDTTVLFNYPIAWANLTDFYVYGLKGSTFTDGVLYLTVYEVRSGS